MKINHIITEFVTPQATAQDPGLEEGNVTKTNTGIVHRATDKYGAGDEPFNRYNPGKYVRDLTSLDKQQVKDLDDSMGITWKNHGTNGVAVDEGTAGLPDPNNFDSDNDYRDALDAYAKPQDTDADYENMDETKEKIGNMDADAFDAALSRMKKLAGAGPLRTVYDPARRVYKNVPHAVQPAQQPKKVR
jgi:hypothetical protein